MRTCRRAISALTNEAFMRAREEWSIGIVERPISSFLEQDWTPRINWIRLAQKNCYFADPFAVTFNGKIHILCEQFDYRQSKGRIVAIELDEYYAASHPKPAMEFPFHASYPYLFKHNEDLYCVPETALARNICLYKATNFPTRWINICTLVQGFAGSDPTLFNYDGRWWLTATGETSKDKFSRLFAWHAPSLTGPWKQHEANPVKVDFQSARPAGTPFTHEGYLYRPAQDCSKTYGGRVVINRVKSLTESEFAEETAAVVEPEIGGLYPDGLHTISAAGRITLLDGKRLKSSIPFAEAVSRWKKGRVKAHSSLPTRVWLMSNKHGNLVTS